MDKIQRTLIKLGHRDLAQEYYNKISTGVIGNKIVESKLPTYVSSVMINGDKVSFMIWDNRSKEWIDHHTLEPKVQKILKDEGLVESFSGPNPLWRGVKMSKENIKELRKRLRENRWKWNSSRKAFGYPVERLENAVTIMMNSITKK